MRFYDIKIWRSNKLEKNTTRVKIEERKVIWVTI